MEGKGEGLPAAAQDGSSCAEEAGQGAGSGVFGGSGGENAPQPKRRRRKLAMALAVVVVVAGVAAAGFWVWHEQPSFCGTVCHDTMGPYLEGYESGDCLANAHAQADVACLDCHEADFATQVAELQVQLSGDYRLPLAKMETDDAFCLRDGCHTRDGIAAATADYTCGDGEQVNPHEITFSNDYGSDESPHEVAGEAIACATCHTSHRESAGIDYCYDTCHHAKTFESCYDCHDHR